ncbi:ABC-2 type transport system permease protein [Fibrobacter sp. UWCM]|jgi:ABC-2 type transport system permease protein|uniref:ABC transporter permease n=1 Tax=unclassified Fibrobacter TaxID=2634177 RepID=UPI00090FFDBD|nr:MULTISPECIES: ABC transporter permease [unclassified Fibrobacter]MBO6135000.1 ABC transporter permease [Fibrobacter sp.]MBQ9226700.1 ABC transporter permease [Fibrobacter sp.]MBR2059034.1 ABC transporter permease [Fibrobacter sp.]MBR2307251.1 ABC transporter permease [Fibrobacter sp.]MBR4007378.1 ABC transporter permease [Fibrobacter sp.]
MIRRLWKVAFAEWKLFYTDPAAILLLVVAGVLYAFYYPTPYIYQTVSKVPVAVVDLDNTAMSRDLIRMASAAQQIEVKSIYAEMNEAEAAMAREEIFGFMVIPENMEKDIRAKRPVSVNIFTHGAYVMLHGAIGTAFSTCALTVGATNKVKQIALGKKVPSAKAIAMRDPIPISIQTMFNSSGSYSNYVVPSVLVVILQQSLIIGICVLGGSRAHRRFRKKFRDSPVENETAEYRYFGRALAYFLHYCSFILFYHCIIYNLFDFPRRGELLPMMVFSLVFLASVINLGMVVSQVFLRRESSMQLFLYLSIPILFLANFSWPSYLMPQWMVSISYILPSTFAIPAWLSIEQMGADIYEVAPKLYQLAIQAVVYLVLGLVLTRARDKAKIDIGDM